MIKQILNKISNLVFSPVCISCNRIIYDFDNSNLCKDCFGKIKTIKPESSCKVCSKPFEVPSEYTSICFDCRQTNHHFQYNKSFFVYQTVVREIMHHFKFHGNIRIVKELFSIIISRNLLNGIISPDTEYVLVPVPLDPKTFRMRGFNQTFIIAEFIQSVIDQPIIYDGLIKEETSRLQSSLSKSERRKSVAGKYMVNSNYNFKMKNVILVDDIYTTGSTMDECSKILKKEGTNSIISITLCRGT